MASERATLPAYVVPLHYDLELTPNLNGENDFKYAGKCALKFRMDEENIDEITLHAKEVVINSASIQLPDGARIESKATKYDEKEMTVQLTFANKIPKDTCILAMEFTGIHNADMAGFYRSKYKGLDGSSQTMVTTQFEPCDARRCFPCIDEPAAKATFSVTLNVPKALDALSNMPIVAETSIPGTDKKKLVYAETPKMSTYLLAFVVGELEFMGGQTENGVRLRVYTVPGRQKEAKFALDAGIRCLDIYDKMFGQPFPLPKMDMIAIPDFAMGAMENWGLVTYREVDLLIDAEKASSSQKQRVGEVVAHELAHQWFGNLVTMEWWNDLWLNEGFASWMQNYSSNIIFPEWKLWEQFITTVQAQALSLDALTSSHPIQVPVKHAGEIEQAFDIISYRKGASIVRLAHAMLGEDSFIQGLQAYMAKHKYSNTVTTDLWNAWGDASGLPVAEVMSTWTQKMGYPLITVSENDNDYILTQEWFLADGSKPEGHESMQWIFPLFVSTNAGVTKLKDGDGNPLLMKEKVHKISKADFPEGFVKLNGGQYVPMRANYSASLWDKLTAAVKEKKMDVIDRAALINDCYALVKAGKTSPIVLCKLLEAYKGETEYTVWLGINTALNGISSILEDDHSLDNAWNALARSLVHQALAAVGWEDKPSDGHLTKLLRTLLISLAGKFLSDDSVVVSEAKKRFDAYVKAPTSLEGTNALPSDFRTQVMRIVLKNDNGRDSFDTLLKVLKQLDNTAERKIIYFALGSVQDIAVKREVLKWATSDEVKLQDFIYPVASVHVSGSEGRDLAWSYFKENFDNYVKMLENASSALFAHLVTYSASGFASEAKAKDIEDFFQGKQTKADVKVKQIIEENKGLVQFRNQLLSGEGSAEFKAFLLDHSAKI